MMPIQNVLIIDDSKTELMFLTNLLQKNHMRVRTAEGADEALWIVISSSRAAAQRAPKGRFRRNTASPDACAG